MKQETKISEIDILKAKGFKPFSDLNYALDNGIDYYIGFNKKDAAIVAIIKDEDNYFIDKEGLRQMAFDARLAGIEHVTLYTNYGIELHSKLEKPNCVGLDRIIKVDSEGLNY